MTTSDETMYMPLSAVPDFIPSARSGRRLGLATVWRWATKGTRGIRLRTFKIGGSRYTTLAAIQEFIDASNASPDDTKPEPIWHTRKSNVSSELDRRGFRC